MPFSFGGGALILKWQQLGSALVRRGSGQSFFKDAAEGGGASLPIFFFFFHLYNLTNVNNGETLRHAVIEL